MRLGSTNHEHVLIETETHHREHCLVPFIWCFSHGCKRRRIVVDSRIYQNTTHAPRSLTRWREMVYSSRLDIDTGDFGFKMCREDTKLNCTTPRRGLEDGGHVLQRWHADYKVLISNIKIPKKVHTRGSLHYTFLDCCGCLRRQLYTSIYQYQSI